MITKNRGVEVRFQYVVYLLRPNGLGHQWRPDDVIRILAVAYDGRRPGYWAPRSSPTTLRNGQSGCDRLWATQF